MVILQYPEEQKNSETPSTTAANRGPGKATYL